MGTKNLHELDQRRVLLRIHIIPFLLLFSFYAPFGCSVKWLPHVVVLGQVKWKTLLRLNLLCGADCLGSLARNEVKGGRRLFAGCIWCLILTELFLMGTVNVVVTRSMWKHCSRSTFIFMFIITFRCAKYAVLFNEFVFCIIVERREKVDTLCLSNHVSAAAAWVFIDKLGFWTASLHLFVLEIIRRMQLLRDISARGLSSVFKWIEHFWRAVAHFSGLQLTKVLFTLGRDQAEWLDAHKLGLATRALLGCVLFVSFVVRGVNEVNLSSHNCP